MIGRACDKCVVPIKSGTTRKEPEFMCQNVEKCLSCLGKLGRMGRSLWASERLEATRMEDNNETSQGLFVHSVVATI